MPYFACSSCSPSEPGKFVAGYDGDPFHRRRPSSTISRTIGSQEPQARPARVACIHRFDRAPPVFDAFDDGALADGFAATNLRFERNLLERHPFRRRHADIEQQVDALSGSVVPLSNACSQLAALPLSPNRIAPISCSSRMMSFL